MASELESTTPAKEISHKPARPTTPMATPSNAAKEASFRATSAYQVLRSISTLASGEGGVFSAVTDGGADDMDLEGDMSSDDYDSSESDRDDNSVKSWHSDDEAVYSDDENNNAQGESTVDPSHHAVSGMGFQLPPTRSAAASTDTMTGGPQGPKALQKTTVSKIATSPGTKTELVGTTSAKVHPPSTVEEKEAKTSEKVVEVAPPKPTADTTAQAASKPIQSTPPKTVAESGQIPKTKIIKVRKPDGTIIKVKRRITSADVPAQAKTEEETAKSVAGEVKASDAKDQSSKPQLQRPQGQTKNDTEKEPGDSEKLQKESSPSVVVHELEKSDESSQDVTKPLKKMAQSLERRTSKVTQIIIWTIMILFPLLFIVIGVITAVVTGMPEDSALGVGITQASRVSVSLWPIVFAALLTQVLRMYASYKVERGMRLMTLEQLMGSHSVANAIKQPFLLQRFNRTSLALLCLWCLSPLAGQALLRMSYVDFDGSVHNVTIQYLDTTAAPVAFEGGSSIASLAPELDALLGASILAPIAIQQESMDTWGNVKVPTLENLTLKGDDGWSTVGDSPSYSSLVGVPVRSLTDGGKSSFSMNSAYFHFTCPALVEMTMDEANATVSSIISSGLTGRAVLRTAVIPLTATQPGTLFFAAQDPENPKNVAYTACSFTTSFVESLVSCTGTQCAVGAMRSASPVPFDPQSGIELSNCITFLTISGAASDSDTYPNLLFFISDPASAGTSTLTQGPDILNVPIADFTARLSLLVNTYWQTGIAPWFFTGHLNTTSAAATLLNTSAVDTSTALVYHTSWAWLTVLLVSGVVLLVGGVAGAICDVHTIGPDIFGFASSLANRNKYMRVPTSESSGTTGTAGIVSGPQRARMLGHLKVMLQDVKADAKVGKIALGTVDNGGERLKPGRPYR